MSSDKENKSTGSITLIGIEPQPTGTTDRAGGQQHAGGFLQTVKGFFTRQVSESDFRHNLDTTLQQLQSALTEVANKAVAGMELESITVSLAVSMEGTIGIATAGTETSMEVTFARKRQP